MRRQLTGLRRAIAFLVALAAGMVVSAGASRAGVPPGYHLYVVNFRDGYISVIDSGTKSEVRRIELGARAHPVELIPSADFGRIYVCNRGLDEIAVVDAAKGTIESRIKVGLHPHLFKPSPDGRYIVVANLLDTSLSVIDIQTRAVVARPHISDTDSGASGVAFTNDGAFAYITSIYTDVAYVIDMKEMKVVQEAPAPDSLDIEIPPGSHLAYYASHTDRLSILDTRTNEAAGYIPLGYAPSHVTISKDGATAFVPNIRADFIWVVDLAERKVVKEVKVGPEPLQSALSPDGKYLFVANYAGHKSVGSVSVVDTGTLEEVDRFVDLPFPRALAVIPAE
jgi:YVTN family beta-propeller protein